MLKIKRFTCENQVQECVTDNNNVRFGFTLESDRKGASLKKALLKLNNWECETVEQISIPYLGEELKPFTKYTAFLEVEDDSGEKASETMTFETGRLNEPWQGKWITDGKYIFKENKISPVPMVFRKVIETKKTIKNAKLYVTAI